MKKGTRKLVALFLALCLAFTPVSTLSMEAEAADINNIGSPTYTLHETMDGSEVFVYAYNVMDYGADNTGNNDNTEIFQKLLNKVNELGGGIVYVPSGMYKISGALSIPRGVILRGDWQQPDKNSTLPEGTILMAYEGRNGNEYSTPFIEMCIETGLMDMTIWYPEQDPNNIVPYSPTIRYGYNNYFGNEYCNTQNVTLVNSYIGILFNYDNGGASPIVKNLYGTTLKKGVEIDKIADVGRIDGVNFSPDYWINSGFSNAPTDEDSFRTYMKENSIGIVMRRNDWSYTCNITIDGYMSGYNTEISVGSSETPNGHHYNFNFTDCTTGITINATNSVGILFDDITIKNCENGVLITEGTGDVVEFFNTTIDASKYAIRTALESSTKVLFNQSTVERGQVAINGGTFTANSSAFNNLQPQIYFGLTGRGVITGCTFAEGRQITNNSIYETSISDTAAVTEAVEEFPEDVYETKLPTRRVLYNAAEAPYYASTSSSDNTTAIQNALNQASADGGGIVFLPSGKYKVLGHLTIPSNVELRGALDIQTVPHGAGTILEAYENRGNESGDSFIQLKENSGIRAIVIDYPEQVFDGSDTWMPAAYPYTIQGQGDNVYVINTNVRASYKGLDLFTYNCDNHYVDFMGGHVFNVGVRVGNNATDGKLLNMMFNVIVYACGNESKFGSFTNMPDGVSNARLYAYGLDYLDFMILGDCTNEILYNDFHYGSRHGLVLQSDGNGGPQNLKSMGLGIDGSARSIYVKSGTTGEADLFNTQVVAIVGSDAADTSYFQIEDGASMDINMYNSDYWGQPNKGIETGNNDSVLTLYGAHFSNPGQVSLGWSTGGDVEIIGSNLNQNGTAFVDSGSESNISVTGSTVNSRDNATSSFAAWDTNQDLSPTMASDSITSDINRSGWTASASDNNGNAWYSLDGDVGTRWDTAGSQVSGQWYAVDFGSTYTFNTIIIDLGSSTSDAPAGYEIYATDDLNNWGSAIASGTGGSVMTFDTQSKRYVVIKQTGSKSNYWSIHEFYAYALDSSNSNDLPNGEVEGGTTEEEDTVPALDRTGWSATASNNSTNVNNALDGDIDTRWDTNAYQTSGQWFTVNLGEPQFFNTVEMLLGDSTGDAPAAYEIYVSLDGENWELVKSGTNAAESYSVGTQYAQYVKVVQTGSNNYYWSIHEFNLKDTKYDTYYNVAYVDGSEVLDIDSYAIGKTLGSFADAPEADGKIFAGWYSQAVTLDSTSAVSAAASKAANASSVSANTAVYAGWIEIGSDEFELLGTQVRITDPSGLRFITQIGTDLIAEIEALNSANSSLQPDSASDKGIGFGTVTVVASKVSGDIVKDVNATQVVKGMVVSPAVKNYEKTEDYIQYTCVVTGIGASYYETEIAARPYITYKDANGVERTYYYTEAGTNVGGGYSVSLYNAAKAVYSLSTTSSSIKTWLSENIISVVEN